MHQLCATSSINIAHVVLRSVICNGQFSVCAKGCASSGVSLVVRAPCCQLGGSCSVLSGRHRGSSVLNEVTVCAPWLGTMSLSFPTRQKYLMASAMRTRRNEGLRDITRNPHECASLAGQRRATPPPPARCAGSRSERTAKGSASLVQCCSPSHIGSPSLGRVSQSDEN